ncbi:NADH pyrophosphatase [Actinoplanes capillaceus]|uniref:NAD(+) diphosphatase n=1 Tax=Actinoplanes campanulatus TaxID=113559 RepID=A0ABQ3WV18_9ACTN|nr:NAD(+) diphosphatase [Actinoplanes capillaceus]GID49991.1 NADH pyrophosphatase [Actinoplanes capillaceus]
MTFEDLAYTRTPQNRMPGRRGDVAWVASQQARPDMRVIPIWRDRCLVDEGRPVEIAGSAAHAVLRASPESVLLGLEEEKPVFAADLSELDEGDALRACGAQASADVRKLVPVLPSPQAATLAYARGLLHWNRHTRFCGSCGAATRAVQAGHVRVCTAESCGRQMFPRIEPAVIVLVQSSEPEPRCLLARHHGAGPDGFSLLAGFVEIGEGLEAAVRREVAEEAGVAVGEVAYRGSQGWPFPAGLMVGFTAHAMSEAITVDGEELMEARWFHRAEIVERITSGPGPGPEDSIGGRLLRTWAGA